MSSKGALEAAAAAQAAGRPLQLHTLRAAQWLVPVRTAGRLLACLPHLCCLALWIDRCEGANAALQHLAPLQRATQLKELYLKGYMPGYWAGLLPGSLKRLSCTTQRCHLSHLTQLTFLQLCNCDGEDSQLPPGLQQLEVVDEDNHSTGLVEEQQQVVTAWHVFDLKTEEVQQLLVRLPNLRAVSVAAEDLANPATVAALQQLSGLSALTYSPLYLPTGVPAAVPTAGSMRNLRRLHLNSSYLETPPASNALTQLTQLTQLRVCKRSDQYLKQQQCRAWAEVVARIAGLQWLSVPDMLLTAGWAWLGGLQQLRVLVLHRTVLHGGGVPWLGGCSREVLPPRLQVLGVWGLSAEQAASWQVRRRLQRILSSSCCEVVVGPDLYAVADPTQQLAGLPVALQQALA